MNYSVGFFKNIPGIFDEVNAWLQGVWSVGKITSSNTENKISNWGSERSWVKMYR